MNQRIAINFVFKLIDRGLTLENIEAAMVEMIGKDWKVTAVSDWIKKFKEKGYLPQQSSELSVDDLEVMIINRLSLSKSSIKCFSQTIRKS